jgi:hypothetical protein
MNNAALDLLNVDGAAASAAMRFYSAYGITCMREADRISERVDDGSSARMDAESRLMEAASSFRQAASWACLIDTDEAEQLLDSAAGAYLRLGFGFGAYLAAVAAMKSARFSRPEETERLLQAVDILQSSHGEEQSPNSNAVPEAMRHPQQQAYVALAAAASDRLRSRVIDVVRRSGQLQGVLPVGALGTPIRRMWAVALALVERDLATALNHVGAMAQRFNDTSESAMSNPRLWRNAHVRFDTVDLDIVGLTALLIKRFSRDAVSRAMEERHVFGPGPAIAQFHIALDLVDG